MNRFKILRIVLSSISLIAVMLLVDNFEFAVWQQLLMFLFPYAIAGYDVVGEAIEGIFHGEAFNEDFLMTIATVGALTIGFLPDAEPEFAEAVFVMLFFQVGELFEDYAEGKSRKSISHLMDIRPDVAHLVKDGAISDVAPETVSVGDTVQVLPGEKIPLDGVVVDGVSSLDTVALTGESIPRAVEPGSDVISGCVNVSGVLVISVRNTYEESTASKILDLVENASANKSRSETFIARFSRIYTPVVVLSALLLAFVPPILSSQPFLSVFSVWLNRALTFLVVSCPCALVISVPLSFFGGIGGASRKGILIKGANFMDTLSKLGVVVFDKTGTLTKGKFEVEAVHPEKLAPTQMLHLAAHVERYSNHPIALSLRNAFPGEHDDCVVENVEEIAGRGVRATVNGKTVCVGNYKMMDDVGAKWHDCHRIGTVIHVAVDGVYAGHIVIADSLKDDAAKAISMLRKQGVSKVVMLTGDRNDVAADVARRVGVDECHSELLPADKVSWIERLSSTKIPGSSIAFVGDGINDAPVLARADVGIAMGALGSDAAIEAADVVLMDDKPSKIAEAVAISRRTIRIAWQNAWFAIIVKLLVLFLAVLGCASMSLAVFADVGVTVLAVLNAMRTLDS